jgi:hypothetical protein
MHMPQLATVLSVLTDRGASGPRLIPTPTSLQTMPMFLLTATPTLLPVLYTLCQRAAAVAAAVAVPSAFAERMLLALGRSGTAALSTSGSARAARLHPRHGCATHAGCASQRCGQLHVLRDAHSLLLTLMGLRNRVAPAMFAMGTGGVVRKRP